MTVKPVGRIEYGINTSSSSSSTSIDLNFNEVLSHLSLIKPDEIPQFLIVGSFFKCDFTSILMELSGLQLPRNQTVTMCRNAHYQDRIDFLKNFMLRIQKDLDELGSAFHFALDEVRHIEASFTKGDSHNNGESPLFITIKLNSASHDVKIVYKPRNLGVDSLCCSETGLFASINKVQNETELPTQTFLLKDDHDGPYGYENFVEGQMASLESSIAHSKLPKVVKSDDETSVKHFEEFISSISLKSLKANYLIIKSLIMIGASDQHFGNFIINKDNILIPIDLESFEQKISDIFINKEVIGAEETLNTCLTSIERRIEPSERATLDKCLEQVKWTTFSLNSCPNRFIPISTATFVEMQRQLFRQPVTGDNPEDMFASEDTGSGGMIVKDDGQSQSWLSSDVIEEQELQLTQNDMQTKAINIKQIEIYFTSSANNSQYYQNALNELKKQILTNISLLDEAEFEQMILQALSKFHVPLFTLKNNELYLNREKVGEVKVQ